MKKSSAPDISAPLSRSGARRKKSLFNRLCGAAMILVLNPFSLGGMLFYFARSNINDLEMQARQSNDEGVAAQQLQSQLRRQQKSTDIIITDEEKRDPTNTNGLLIRTSQIGDIRIAFRPDLAGPSSIQYVIDVVEAAGAASKTDGNVNSNGVACSRCKFYRAEKNLLLQGVLNQNSIRSNTVSLGPCPEEVPPQLHCPEHDPNCACHGPIMTIVSNNLFLRILHSSNSRQLTLSFLS